LKGIKLTFRKEKGIYAYSKLPEPQIFRQKAINVEPLILVNRDPTLWDLSSSKGITTSYKGSWFLDISKEGFLRFNSASKIRVHSKRFPIQSSSYTFGDLITGQGSNYSNADNNNTNLKIEYMKKAVYSLWS
jgi:hypothetical protein